MSLDNNNTVKSVKPWGFVRTLSLEEIEGLKYNELIQYGVAIGVPYQRQSKAVLLQMVLDQAEKDIKHINADPETPTPAPKPATPEPKKVVAKKRQIDVHITENQQEILNNDGLSKSEKMRRLYRRGMTIADIHRVLQSHYSFTYGVIDRYRKMISRGE